MCISLTCLKVIYYRQLADARAAEEAAQTACALAQAAAGKAQEANATQREQEFRLQVRHLLDPSSEQQRSDWCTDCRRHRRSNCRLHAG